MPYGLQDVNEPSTALLVTKVSSFFLQGDYNDASICKHDVMSAQILLISGLLSILISY